MKNLEYSSKSQAENGTDNTTIMTPLRVKQSIAANARGGEGGTSDYNDLENKPKINNVELNGNKTAQDLGISGNIQGDWNVTDPTNGAYIKNKPTIPSKTSDLTNDSNFVSDASYVHTDNNYTTTEKNKLAGIEAGAEANVQANWNESDTTSDTYIQNKPTIPTKVSDLQNDSGFITTETDPVFGNSVAYTIDDDDIDYWNDKQPPLVSGQNIKTINNMSILGAGNLLIGEGGIMATDVSINGTSITSDGSANIVTDGAYDPDNNKIATQSTVEAAIGDLIDYVYYQEESFTNPITGTTATEGVVSVGKADNPVQLKLGRNVVKVRLNNSDVVYIGTDTGGKTRIYANNMNALQSIKLGDFSWTKLSDGSIVFGGDE